MIVFMTYKNNRVISDFIEKTGQTMDPKTKSDIQTNGRLRVLSCFFNGQVGEYVFINGGRYRLATKDASPDGVRNDYLVVREDRTERTV